MRVLMPPISAPNDKGINNFDGALPVFLARSMTAGSMSAATPMEFINPDNKPTVSIKIAVNWNSLLPAKRLIKRATHPATPVFVSPSLKMRIAQTVMTAKFEKPDKASVGVTSPASASESSTRMATTSTRSFSVMKRLTEISKIANTAKI